MFVSGSSSLRLHFVKQAAPSATSTCNIYPECIEFATIIKVISIQMSEAAGVEERLLNGGNGCRSPRRMFVALRIGARGAGSEMRVTFNEMMLSHYLAV